MVEGFDTRLKALGCDIHCPAWPDHFASIAREYCLNTDTSKNRIRILSLFSGGGGLDIGFCDAGFEVEESVELEKTFCDTLTYNCGLNKYFSSMRVNCVDIRDYIPPTTNFDFIIGGPPCQTFSAAGRRANGVLGTNDARGILFKEYARILDQIKPTGFLFENVYGITGAQNGEAWAAIKQSFEKLGYKLYYRVLDAADYGVPQHRERLFVVGLKNNEYCFPRPLFGVDSIEKLPFYNSGLAITGANKKEDELPQHISGKFADLIDEIPPGLNYSYYTEHMGHPNPIFAWRSKFSDFLYKADPEQPVRTIKAQGGQYTGPFHWDGRHFTLSEYKRLQTFPDAYTLKGGRTDVIRQLGNSVPPQLARILALSIRDQIFSRNIPLKFDYLRPETVLSFRKEKAKLTKVYREKAKIAISAAKKNTHNKKISEFYSVDVDSDFRFVKNEIAKSGRYSVQCCDSFDKLSFDLEEMNNKKGSSYQYSLYIEPINSWHLTYNEIEGHASGSTRLVLTALWKTIEDALAVKGKAADLVQLNGYYQYYPKLKIKLESVSGSTIDRAISSTATGRCTRRIIETKELALLWETTENEVLECAKEMKLLGFEIRNTNTNPQIPYDHWLVPYEFPTLNPMSIQLRKQV